MNLFDTATFDSLRRTADGYLVTDVRVARTGVQSYKGKELGIEGRDSDTIRLWRPEDEVFKDTAMQSYAHRPVTIEHPKKMVDATTWKEVSVGQTGDQVVRDGQFVRVPMVLMDAAAIKAVESGKRELSMGYTCEIELADGVTPDGEPYDAIQRNLRMNHLAVVTMARGGSQLKLGDELNQEEEKMTDNVHKTRTVLVDGLQVETTDAGAAAIERLQRNLADAAVAAKAANDAASAEMAKRDAEIDGLKKQVLTDAALDARVASRIALVDNARKIDPKVVTDGKTDDEIRRAVVVAAIGDTMASKDTAYLNVRFDVLVEDAAKADPVRKAAMDGSHVRPHGVNIADAAYADSLKEAENAWKGTSQKVEH